jgi:hypothetical protein
MATPNLLERYGRNGPERISLAFGAFLSGWDKNYRGYAVTRDVTRSGAGEGLVGTHSTCLEVRHAIRDRVGALSLARTVGARLN